MATTSAAISRDLTETQYREHPGWSMQLPFDNLRAALSGGDSPLPSYPNVRRHLKARGMFRQARPKRSSDGAPLARDRLERLEVRSFEVTRTRRRSDATVSLEGQRFEIPATYRHLGRGRVRLRHARWDLSRVDLVDARSGAVLCPLHPLDRSANADGRRRALRPTHADRSPPAAGWLAPLLKQLLADYAATGLPPAYLPTDRLPTAATPDQEPA